jgi:hypothetical protein
MAKLKKWIQKAKLKKGCLSKQLGIPIEKNIPMPLLNKVAKTEIGKKVATPKGKITVTPLLKKRAVMARTLKSIKR